jgi:monomeric isocitrate dehydrogenase
MAEGDFYGSEQSHIMEAADTVSILFTPADREGEQMSSRTFVNKKRKKETDI